MEGLGDSAPRHAATNSPEWTRFKNGRDALVLMAQAAS